MNHQRIFDSEMGELKDLILKMGIMVQESIQRSVEALKRLDKQMAEAVVSDDNKIDQLELEIDEKSIQLVALRQPEASDLRFLMTGMRISNDLERIGDMAVDIAERAIDLSDKPLLKPLIDIPKMAILAQETVALALDAFINKDSGKVREIRIKEKESDKLRDLVHEELVEIMTKDSSTVSRAIPLLLVSRHLERITDHATNIGEEVVYMVDARVIKHGGAETAG
ncbi:MAG: phosphate signaling complex protein PhoU [Candidatus Margulisiibacteriota bacterium]|jgi:phosphate transport system protein